MTIISDKHPEAAPLTVPPPRPDFSVAVRGYERTQVDEYAGLQQAWAREVEARLQAAERAYVEANGEIARLQGLLQQAEERELSAPPRSVQAIGDRVTRILQSSWDIGEQLRDEAEGDAARIQQEAAELMDDTRDRAQQLLAEAREEAAAHKQASAEEARREAEALLAAARADAERFLDEAHAAEADALARRDDLEARVSALASHHAAAMEELSRVRRALDATLGAPPSAAVDDEPVINIA
jgi:hypothetical protein